MSEAMALESLAEQWLRSEGYWTQTRVPFRMRRGNSDLDVLGVNLKRRVVVIECKGWGGPEYYPTYNTQRLEEEVVPLCRKAKKDLKYFLASVASRKLEITRVYEFRLVLPGHLPDGAQKRDMEKDLKKRCGLACNLRIFSVHEVIRDLQKWVGEDMHIRRKRYADTALEMLRWVWRSGGQICWRNPKGE